MQLLQDMPDVLFLVDMYSKQLSKNVKHILNTKWLNQKASMFVDS